MKWISTFALIILAGILNYSSIFAQANICGYVYSVDDSTAIRNATVFLYNEYNLPFEQLYRTKTDSTGFYSFHNMESRKYSVNTLIDFEFRKEEFTHVYQPGIFNVDTSVSAFKTPCFNVNFGFPGKVDSTEFEKWKKLQLDVYALYNEKIPDDIDWPIMILAPLISMELQTVDSLFESMSSAYVTRKR